MNLEQAKKETSERFAILKNALQYAECYLYEDLNIPEEPLRLMFGRWSIPESYLSEEIEASLIDLIKNIEVVKIFENHEKDSKDLLSWMVHELQFERFETNFIGNEIPYKVDNELLNRIYTERLQEFEKCRRDGHKMVIDTLKAQTHSNNKSSTTKSRVKIEKLVWMGEQYQLIELFRTLINRNWIKKDLQTSPTANARAILEAIDISLTKKTPTSNEVNSFIKSYIGEYNKVEPLYPGNPEFAIVKGYKPVFEEIKNRR